MKKMTKMALLMVCCYLSELVGLDPVFIPGYIPVVFLDNTGQTVYFLGLGDDPCGTNCYLVPNAANGQCQYVYPNIFGNPNSSSPLYSVALNTLPTATHINNPDGYNAYLVYIPVCSGARIYLSINNPIYLPIVTNGDGTGILIGQANAYSTSDPNYYTLYQAIEFGYGANISIVQQQGFFNLSYVDNFSFPMQLANYAWPSNQQITSFSEVQSGFELATTRESIVTAVTNTLSKGESAWASLPLLFYPNPYTDSASMATTLRIPAAKNSMGFSTAFIGANVAQASFPSNYASNPAAGPVSSQSFFGALYSYYSNPANALYFTVNSSSGAVITMTSDTTAGSHPGAATQTLQFSGGGDTMYLDLTGTNALSSSQLLSGSSWPFYGPFPYTSAQVSEMLSGLFTIGQLPPIQITTSSSSPLDGSSFGKNGIFKYYIDSYWASLQTPQNLPWYNLYDQALHQQYQLGVGTVPNNPLLGVAYSYDYDDLLHMDGTLTPVLMDGFGNFNFQCQVEPTDTSAYILFGLGSLTGTTIPNILADSLTVNTVNIGASTAPFTATFSWYASSSGSLQTMQNTAAGISLGTVYTDATHPFEVTFTYNDVSYTFNINLMRQLVTLSVPTTGGPISTTQSYGVIETFFMSAITFAVNAGGSGTNPTSMTIGYGSGYPPWPG